MEKANKKRMIISLVYLLLLSLIAGGIYILFKPKETCLDKIKNQNEEDVDCGGVCEACKRITAEPLLTGEAGIVQGGISGQYDFYGEVINPNNIYGSQNFRYSIKLKDGSGNVLEQRQGTSYILPGETKYIVEANFKPSLSPVSYEFTVSDPVWMKFTGYYEKPQIKIVNKNYDEIKNGVGFSQATGLLKNESPYDFNLIRIAIILRDADRKVVAINYTEVGTVKSKEERDFRVFWPNRFSGEVNDVEAQIEVNIFNSQAFMKQFIKNE